MVDPEGRKKANPFAACRVITASARSATAAVARKAEVLRSTSVRSRRFLKI